MKNRTIPYLTGLFFDSISSGLFMMALPWVMLSEQEMGTFVALVALSCTLVSFLAAPFLSTLIDRHSRKRLLIQNQWLQAGTATIIFVAYSFELDSNWLLAIAQLVYWVSSSFAWTTNGAFTQENYQRHEYAKISGQQEIVMQSTTLGSGALGIILLEIWGMREFALFGAAASSLAALCYMLTPYNQQLRQALSTTFLEQLRESKHIFSEQKPFFAFILLSCLSYPMVTYLGKLVPIWFSEQGLSGQWFAGFNLSFGLGSLFTGFIVARILNRFTQTHIIMLSMGVLFIILFGMSLSTDPLTILLFTALFGAFNALNRITRIHWMHNTIPLQKRGRVDGGLLMFSTTAQSLSYALIAILSNYHLTHYGFIVAAAILSVAVGAMWLLHKKLDNPNHKQWQEIRIR